MKKFKLYIDESGREHLSHASTHYVLIGCLIEKGAQQELEIRANQIKYRYWKRTDVVFHSKEIAFNQNEFSIFANDSSLRKEFISDLLNLMHVAPIKVTCCIVDKAKVYGYKVPWKHTTIIEKTTNTIVLDFLRYIYSWRSTGIIIYEASGFEKDAEYLKAFNKVLTPAWITKHPEFQNIREHLTSITFATKLNHDIECEFADLLSYAALRKYQDEAGIKAIIPKSYEDRLVKILETKLLQPSPSLRQSKRKYDYMSEVVGYCKLP